MEQIGFEEIERRLRAVFPNLEVWAPTDATYLTVDLAEMDRLVDRNPAQPWLKNINECEEIADRFLVNVRDWELDSAQRMATELRFNRALGVASGGRFQNVDKDHTVNVFAADDGGIYLLDMQVATYWRAVKGADDIYFVRM